MKLHFIGLLIFMFLRCSGHNRSLTIRNDSSCSELKYFIKDFYIPSLISHGSDILKIRIENFKYYSDINLSCFKIFNLTNVDIYLTFIPNRMLDLNSQFKLELDPSFKTHLQNVNFNFNNVEKIQVDQNIFLNVSSRITLFLDYSNFNFEQIDCSYENRSVYKFFETTGEVFVNRTKFPSSLCPLIFLQNIYEYFTF
jgi:hypothetical protein